MRRLVGGCRRGRSSSVLPFVGSAAPIAAFVATKGGGRTGPAPGAKRRAEAKRRMAGAGYFASRCKGGLARRRKIVGRPPLPGRAVCRIDRPLRRPWARSSPAKGSGGDPTRCDVRRRRNSRPSDPGHAASSMKRATSCGAIWVLQRCPKRIDAKRAEIFVEVAEPWRQGNRLDSDLLRSVRPRSPSRYPLRDRRRGRYRAGAACPGTGWRRDARPRAPPPSAWSGMTHRSDSMVSMPSPAAMTSPADTEADGIAKEMAHRPPRRVDRRLVRRPAGSSQVRCAPVILPSRSVTAAIIAGQVSVGDASSGR